jgi:hypothetical protein
MKVDWISQNFYNDLRHLGVQSSKLSEQEQEVQYRDFNGKKFEPTGKVELLIQTEKFKGDMKYRMMSFFIASKAGFAILFGRDTIRKHGFFFPDKHDMVGEGAFVGIYDKHTKGMLL